MSQEQYEGADRALSEEPLQNFVIATPPTPTPPPPPWLNVLVETTLQTPS